MSREQPEAAGALETVLKVLENLGIPYHVGGSFASTLHGVGYRENGRTSCAIIRPGP